MHSLFSLLILNILLQVFDGLATYQGLRLGMREGNALIAAAFQFWGIGLSLLVFKGFACGGLTFVYCKATSAVARQALNGIAVVYGVCSFVPWLVALSATLLRVW